MNTPTHKIRYIAWIPPTDAVSSRSTIVALAKLFLCAPPRLLRRYWHPRAENAWQMKDQVAEALRMPDWAAAQKRVRCMGAGIFGGLQLAKDCLSVLVVYVFTHI